MSANARCWPSTSTSPEFDERELRGAGVGAAASVVASLGAVRRALFDLQRNFAQQKGGRCSTGATSER